MPMSDWLNKLIRRAAGGEGGTALVEFAVMMPLLLLLAVGTIEVGRAYFQANAVEKGVRAGAVFAARGQLPLTAADRATAENIIKTGTIDGSGALLVSGWSKAAASLEITSADFVTGDTSVAVIRVTASVPFDPILPGLAGFVGLDDFTIGAVHEQAYVGD